MKGIKLLTLVAVLMLFFEGCSPDLVVKDAEVVWDSNNKLVKAEIANIGNKDAGPFLVYFNGIEEPKSSNHIPQVREGAQGLAKGNSIFFDADFGPLAHADNFHLGRMYKVLIIADPKGGVKESNEHNNEREVQLPQTDCVNFEQQALSTVYHLGESFSEGGAQLEFVDFYWGNNAPATSGESVIENQSRAGHLGQDLRLDNISVKVDFGSIKGLILFFGESGGNINLELNGVLVNYDNFANTSAAITAAGITGITATVVNGFGHDKGYLELIGTINEFVIGGQELWIDHICPYEN